MLNMKTFIFILTILMLSFSGCSGRKCKNRKEIACSTSYTEAAVYDLLGTDTNILRLAGPGMCPGHFDITPKQVDALIKCRVLFRFDFQTALEKKISQTERTDKLLIGVIKLNRGLCVPDTYLSVCKQCAEILVKAGLANRVHMKNRINVIKKRIAIVSNKVKREIERAGFSGMTVLSSVHQKDFCNWLDLKVVGKLPSADKADFENIEAAIKSGLQHKVKYVIANLQEGRQLADAIAERLGAKIIVFSNFPETNKPIRNAFDKLIETNVDRLIKNDADSRN